MPRNSLGDMHNLLMEQMEKLAEADEEAIENEIKRSQAMTGVAAQVTKNAAMIVRMAQLKSATGEDAHKMLTEGEA